MICVDIQRAWLVHRAPRSRNRQGDVFESVREIGGLILLLVPNS